MNFLQYQERVQEKDVVILCRGYEKMFSICVERGEVIQIRGGAIHHDSLIGKQYGTKVETSNGKNWVLVLHPSPELWTHTLPHRTQIVYSTDAAMITLALGLRPGSKVIESGTGSGAVSHALARSVAPNGRLYTFEFHQQRAQLAQKEFEQHGLGGVVTATCRDVCAEGFGLDNIADAVFLDLPMPWKTIESARAALKEVGGRLCSFSPCMEQVQQTCDQLRASGFSDVDVVECLQRPYEVKTHVLTVPSVGVASGVGGAYSGVSQSLGNASLCAALATNRIPGHTGYIITATLQCKPMQQRNSALFIP